MVMSRLTELRTRALKSYTIKRDQGENPYFLGIEILIEQIRLQEWARRMHVQSAADIQSLLAQSEDEDAAIWWNRICYAISRTELLREITFPRLLDSFPRFRMCINQMEQILPPGYSTLQRGFCPTIKLLYKACQESLTFINANTASTALKNTAVRLRVVGVDLFRGRVPVDYLLNPYWRKPQLLRKNIIGILADIGTILGRISDPHPCLKNAFN